MPSGKYGRARLPIPRLPYAMPFASAFGSLRKLRVAVTKGAIGTGGPGGIGGRQALQHGGGGRAREKRRRARLLQRDVGAEHRRIGCADDAQDFAGGTDDADRDLRGRAAGLANLRAGAIRDLDRALQYLRDLRRVQQAVRRALGRIAVHVRRVDQHVRVGTGERGIGVRTITGGRRAERRAGDDRAGGIAGDGDHTADAGRNRSEGRRAGGIARRRHAVDVAQAAAVDRDVIGAAVRRRVEAARGGNGDHFVEIRVVVQDVEVERIQARRHDSDAADDDAVLVQRQAARLGGETRAACASGP